MRHGNLKELNHSLEDQVCNGSVLNRPSQVGLKDFTFCERAIVATTKATAPTDDRDGRPRLLP